MLRTCFWLAATAYVISNGTSQVPVQENPFTRSEARGSLARIDWGDFDEDGLEDAYVVYPDGRAQLVHNTGSGFVDVTLATGVALTPMPTAASWHDFDGDTRLDLMLFSADGPAHLFRNTGTGFSDLTLSAGLAGLADIERVSWHDTDGDGRADLHAVTREGHLVYRNEVGNSFTRLELPAVTATVERVMDVPWRLAQTGKGRQGARPRSLDGTATSATGAQTMTLVNPRQVVEVLPIQDFSDCTTAVEDLSEPGSCLEASSIPMLDTLYPLSAEFNVDGASGNVGIGTTSPVAQLHIVQTDPVPVVLLESGGKIVSLDVRTETSAEGSIGGLQISGPLFATGVRIREIARSGGETAAQLEVESALNSSRPTLRVRRLEKEGNIIEASSGTDVEFRVDVDGNAYCDGRFSGEGADYAEWLPKRDRNEALEPGDVVGVFSGHVALSTVAAQQHLVVSTNPVLVGNAAGADEEAREGCERIALVGQVPVKVRGRVRAGDFIVASGRSDGTAVARAPRDLRSSDLALLVGTAWEESDAGEEDTRLVNCAVGVDGQSAALQALLRVNGELEAARGDLASLQRAVLALSDRVAALEVRE